MSILRTSLVTILSAALAIPAGAALFIVDTTAVDLGDLVPGDGKCEWGTIVPEGQRCSLRAAVQEANALAGADVIIIPAGWHIVLSQTGRDEDYAATGDLDILEDVTIGSFGPPAPEAWPVVDGNGIDRVFHVWGNFPVLTISGLQITGGVASAPGAESGGGILDNTGQGLNLADCRIHHNVASGFDGGGIYANFSGGGSSSLDGCSIEENRAEGGGTAIYNLGSMLITNSTVADNRDLTPGNGRAAIHNRGGLTIRNSTLSGNQNSAIQSFDDGITPHGLTLKNVTIVGNGGGLDFNDPDAIGSPAIHNTILAHNSNFDCAITATAPEVQNNNNLDSDGTCGLDGLGSDLPYTDPKLGPLQHNGGTTRSMAPLYASPVTDYGNDTSATTHSCEPDDQRGAARPLEGTPGGFEEAVCDIGAVEALPCPDLAQGWVFLDNEVYGPPSGVTVEACFVVNAGAAVDVLAGGALTLRARESIILSDGFTVHSGGEFTAIRDPAAGSGITLP